MKTMNPRKVKIGRLASQGRINAWAKPSWKIVSEQHASAHILCAVYQKAPVTSATCQEGVIAARIAPNKTPEVSASKSYEELVAELVHLHFNFEGDIYEDVLKEEDDSSTGEISAFLNTIYDLARRGKEDHAIDVIFEYINNLLLERQFDTCDRILSEVAIARIPPVLMVSFLTITAAAKPELENRGRFYNIVRRLVARQRGAKAADRLLDGLE